jgi:hypothetical protein
MRNLVVENVKSGKSEFAVDLQGLDKAPIENVQLRDVTFNNVSKGSIVKNVQDIKLLNVRLNGGVVDNLSTTTMKASG